MAIFNHQDGQYLEIDGAQIYVETKGLESGPPLVFLHGGLGSIADFEQLLPLLQDRFRLIGMDSRGQGRSTMGNAPLTYERMAQDVRAVLRHLNPGPATLIGHSDGGIIALRLAVAHAPEVSGIVTIGAHWQLAQNDPTRALLARVTPESWRHMFPDSHAQYNAHNPEPDFERITRDVVHLWLDAGADGYPGETVREITCPLLIIRGDEDRLVSRENTFELAERVPGAQLLNLPFAGHSVQDDQPAQLAWALQNFLKVQP